MILISRFLRHAVAMLTAVTMLLPLLRVQPAEAATTKTQPLSASVQASINHSYGQLPMSFVPNLGQTDKRARFTSRGPGYNLFISPTETVLVLSRPQATHSHTAHPSSVQTQVKREGVALRMSLVGANPKARVQGQERQPGQVNYLLGQDASKWHTGVSTYARVQTEQVWPGIDMVHYGNGQEFEYDFVLAPGAEVSAIAMEVTGVRQMRLDKEGNLLIATGVGEVRQARPVVYQQVGKQRREVAGRYVLEGKRVSFAVGEYDRELPLVIDPVLVYSTYLGGSDYEYGRSITVGSDGSAYITGYTPSTDYPTTTGAFDTSYAGIGDAFVTKLSAGGNALIYSTYLGGTNSEYGSGIAAGSDGSAYITGYTASTDYPTTTGAFDTSNNSSVDAFVTKLSAAGDALVYSTYLGGSSYEESRSITVGSDGSAYITGYTISTDYPTTTGAFDTSYAGNDDAFVTKLSAGGNALVYSTYLGGTNSEYGSGIAAGSDGSAYITGYTLSTDYPTTTGALDPSYNGNTDSFVTRLSAAGALVYSTYLGGSERDYGYGIAVGSDGSAYLTGRTFSPDYPTTTGAFDTSYNGVDAFVNKLSAAGDALLYSTYLGGTNSEYGHGIAVGSDGSAYITGYTLSTDYPTTTGAFDPSYNGNDDAFVTKLSAAGDALVYSTYLGGTNYEKGYGIALGSDGSAYITGQTASTDYPTTTGAFDTSNAGGADAFVTKLTFTSSPVAGDFTGGAKPDILWRNFSSGADTLWQMNGTSYSSSSPLLTVSNLDWQIVGTGNFTGDGNNDILWRNSATGQNVVWVMNGTTYVSTVGLLSVSNTNWQVQAVNDFSGDGKPDIVWRNTATGQNTVWVMNGTTLTVSVLVLEVSNLEWTIGCTGDFSGDGKTDIVWRNRATGQNVVWIMDGTNYVSSAALLPVGDINWSIAGSADYNTDGRPDILWRNRESGADSIWLMNGTTYTSSASLPAVTNLDWQMQGPR